MEDFLIYSEDKTEVVGFKEGLQGVVVIPDNVVRICARAFSNCYEITSVYIPEGVQEIGHSAFSGCESLVSVHLPSTITSIEGGTFADCI